MRITVNVSEVSVELDNVTNLTVEGIETLLNRAAGTALLAYAGLVDIESLTPAEDEETSSTDEE